MKCKLEYSKMDSYGFPINSKANPREKNLMGQDVFIYENFFSNKRGGIFIDIGASDGVSRSNSYFFEKELNWSGICIEAQRHSYDLLVKNRSCICVNECLSDVEEKVEFMTFKNGGDAVGGIIKHYAPEHIEKQVNKWRRNSLKIITKTRKPMSVFDEYSIKKADYLSIDTEGSDFLILKSIDLKALEVKCISIENNYDNIEIKKHLNNQGYKFVQRFRNDDVYVEVIHKEGKREIKCHDTLKIKPKDR